jgi:hypothetical protein
MEAAGSGLRSTVDRGVRFLAFAFGIRRLHLGLVLEHLDVRCRGRSRCPVALRRDGQVFELTLLLAPTERAPARCRYVTLPHGTSLGAGVAATVALWWAFHQAFHQNDTDVERDGRRSRSPGPFRDDGDRGVVR